jgi:hypothetical protein
MDKFSLETILSLKKEKISPAENPLNLLKNKLPGKMLSNLDFFITMKSTDF